jgi:hypothetical protein
MNDFIHISINLPVDLLERSQRLIEQGFASDHNALIASALESLLRQVERQEIDAQLENMAKDADYQALNEAILGEFDESDWETFVMSEC